MMYLSAAAYSDQPHICVWNKFRNAEVINRFEVACDPSGNSTCSGYIAVLHNDHAVVVSFRGTVNDKQFFDEIVSAVMTKESFYGYGRVNKYFHDAYFTLWLSGMKQLLYEVVDYYPQYTLWVTGHSLGGALATLASADLVGTGRFNAYNSLHYNFGSPRVGDEHFAKIFEKLLPDYYRVVHAQDTITTVYPTLLGYSHHHTQIWYNNNMTYGDRYIECFGENDMRCPVRASLDMFDHRHYFNVRVPVYGHNGCVGTGDENDDKVDGQLF
ncbi:unnamed protein product [Bursaphelenchus okinawaensis]|uniref:Fungal lipase-type domain-containing protein n=1 Tax=Bursaphelenchus okinawaensis TaxID=465554 RepID=A0A811LA23_9BILA|nr:unnamed protein product [Bursaphelenchus okinawaensis]CAG9119237.1 unnamed protein product [Bursaphelenchus okinawaensis]